MQRRAPRCVPGQGSLRSEPPHHAWLGSCEPKLPPGSALHVGFLEAGRGRVCLIGLCREWPSTNCEGDFLMRTIMTVLARPCGFPQVLTQSDIYPGLGMGLEEPPAS